jgi:teichuronic acid biosynthesis glycosyltransferase TuaG
MKNEPLVSIITPAYNAERFIEKTIQSVLKQDYTNWEHLIVVDHNSKDSTLKIVQSFSAQDSRIKCITSPTALGASANRNLALDICKGEYVAFIDADDLWTAEKLSKQIGFMIENNHEFSFTSFCRVNEDESVFGKQQEVPLKVNYEDLLRNNSIACLTAVFKKQRFSDIRFQEHGWEDMAYWLQILKRIPFAYSINEVLAHYRIVQGSRSNNKLFASKLRWNTYRKVEHFNIVKSTYLFGIYILTSARKYARF